MRKLLVMMFSALLVAGCDFSSDGSLARVTTSCSNDGQKQFVLDALYDWWLWNDMLPADRSEINIADYESPFWLVVEVTEFYGPKDAAGEPVDVFSYVDSLEADQQFFGEGRYEGFGYRYRLENDALMRVTGVFSGSPAEAAGLERGHAVLALNGRTVADIMATEGLPGLGTITDNNATIDFSIERLDGSTYNAVITKDIVTINPVPAWRTIDIGEGLPPVGYIQFDSFISTAEPAFATVFAEFAAAGVTDVIIDMRYNGGGLVRTAELLGDYLGSLANPGDVFSRTEFNADRAAAYNRTAFFANPAIANGLSTSRFIVIASGGTASASELVTNSLIPYAEVWIVGENTFGKPVGQVGIEFCDKILRPTAFRTTNALGDGDYFDGLPVDCPAEDDVSLPVGDDSDPRLVAALSVAQTGACPLAPAASPGAQAVRIQPNVLYPQGRAGSAAREFAGAL